MFPLETLCMEMFRLSEVEIDVGVYIVATYVAGDAVNSARQQDSGVSRLLVMYYSRSPLNGTRT